MSDPLDSSSNLLAARWAQDFDTGASDSDLQEPWTHLKDFSDNKSAEDHYQYFNNSGYIRWMDLECKRKHIEDERFLDDAGVNCGATFDSVLCWPPTQANCTAVLRCFSEFRGYKYDDTQNATKQCLSNGTWSKTDYSLCVELPENVSGDGVITTSTIYFVGYSISLVALIIAIWIFFYFRDLKCLRNTIHSNLMIAYILVYLNWILTLILELSFENNMVPCVFLVVLLHYFHLTTFFWMFVEGLYLYILVVETLSRDNFKLRIYVCIGWGLPMLFVVVWAVTKSFVVSPEHLPDKIEGLPGIEQLAEINASNLWRHCPWIKPHFVDWIFQAPITLALLLNLLFLKAIMYVLITKLRSANTVETQQYRKAAKALLVLMPLLGVTYVLTIAGPTNGSTKEIFDYVRAVLLSTQGFTVALFYCFLNTEVQHTLKLHFQNWRTRKTLGRRKRNKSKDWSPRSRTESIRLIDQCGTPIATPKLGNSTMMVTYVTTHGNSLTAIVNGTTIASNHPHRQDSTWTFIDADDV